MTQSLYRLRLLDLQTDLPPGVPTFEVPSAEAHREELLNRGAGRLDCNPNRSAEIESLRQALAEGEQNGAPRRLDLDAFLQRMNAENT